MFLSNFFEFFINIFTELFQTYQGPFVHVIDYDEEWNFTQDDPINYVYFEAGL